MIEFILPVELENKHNSANYITLSSISSSYSYNTDT